MCIVGALNILLFKVPEIINEYYHNNRYPTILCAVYITVIPSFVHISPTTSLVVYANPPTHPRHDTVTDLHAHEYTAVHTCGQHPFSPLHISLSYIFMCIVGALNILLLCWQHLEFPFWNSMPPLGR